MGTPLGVPFFHLAAAAVTLAAAVVAALAAVAAIAAAVAQQEDQNDDPAHIPTAETVIAHTYYLRNFLADDPLIP